MKKRKARKAPKELTGAQLVERSMREFEGNDVFQLFLEIAVPRWVERWENKSWDERAARAKEVGAGINVDGAALVVALDEGALSRRKGAIGHGFNLLAEGLALLLLAQAEGPESEIGFTFNGTRWKL